MVKNPVHRAMTKRLLSLVHLISNKRVQVNEFSHHVDEETGEQTLTVRWI